MEKSKEYKSKNVYKLTHKMTRNASKAIYLSGVGSSLVVGGSALWYLNKPGLGVLMITVGAAALFKTIELKEDIIDYNDGVKINVSELYTIEKESEKVKVK